jgi:phosphoribosyl 1,2-cyclic phosphate phosphodiesterase
MTLESFTVTFLGTGTSQGIPMIGCDCHVCQSADKKDKRLRSSVLLTLNGKNYTIDAGPDFRYQMLREGVKDLDGILFTHEHKDHIAGLDDIRPFNYLRQKDMDIYCDERVEKALKRDYYYAFEASYPGVPKINLHHVDKDKTFVLQENIEVIPIEVMHYKLPVKGYRIANFTYITDCKTISSEELKKLEGTEVLVINALREEQHISHLNLQEALELIEIVKPKVAYLTHISHHLGTHEEILAKIPAHVFPAYDGLVIDLKK